MDTKKGGSSQKPAGMTVMLRLIAGVYLVYLAFSLFREYLKPASGGQMIQIGAAVLFAVIGAALAGWSLKKLIKGEYIKNGGLPEDEEDLPSTDNKEIK